MFNHLWIFLESQLHRNHFLFPNQVFESKARRVQGTGHTSLIVKLLVSLFLLAFIANCGTVQVEVYKYPSIDYFPRTVAVLPFTFEKSISPQESPHTILRQEFFKYFSYLGYTDVPLEEVNNRLHKAGYKLHEATTMNIKELREALGVDAVIRGHILEANNFTGGVYAETRIRAQIRMVDLNRSEIMWETDHQELDNTSILALTVVDTIQDQIGNANTQGAYTKVAESFALKVLDAIPDPAELRGFNIHLPQIYSIQADISAKKLSPNDIVRVSITGEPGLSASFDIGDWKTSVPMVEKKAGYYEGIYKVNAQDQMADTLIVASLKDKSGLIGKKFFKAAKKPITTAVKNNEKPEQLLQ